MSSKHNHSNRSIAQSVQQFIKAEEHEHSDFETLAQQLFKTHFQQNLPYQRFCRHLRITPDSLSHSRDIPAVPTSAFKLPDFPLSSGKVTFLTSGTTTETRGAHHFPDTELYDLAALTHWQQHLPDLPLYFLSPPPCQTPQSSLTHMFGHLDRSLNSDDSKNETPFLLRESHFDLTPLVDLHHPVILSGTALAFLHLIESHHPIPLPKGSQLLETGGYKGTTRTLAKPHFYRQLSDFFQLPDAVIHNEYGMTELSSQAYASGSEGTHRFPHWCRHQIICPQTGKELPIGEMGYLQLHDLANVHSVAAIRTQDFAISHPNGSFTLIGRDPGALPRGCSRSSDDSLSR